MVAVGTSPYARLCVCAKLSAASKSSSSTPSRNDAKTAYSAPYDAPSTKRWQSWNSGMSVMGPDNGISVKVVTTLPCWSTRVMRTDSPAQSETVTTVGRRQGQIQTTMTTKTTSTNANVDT